MVGISPSEPGFRRKLIRMRTYVSPIIEDMCHNQRLGKHTTYASNCCSRTERRELYVVATLSSHTSPNSVPNWHADNCFSLRSSSSPILPTSQNPILRAKDQACLCAYPKAHQNLTTTKKKFIVLVMAPRKPFRYLCLQGPLEPYPGANQAQPNVWNILRHKCTVRSSID